MNRLTDLPDAFLIVLALTVLILIGAYLAARYTIHRDQREIERRAKANVAVWWHAAERLDWLPDEGDLAGDGNDEGLVRVPPDALLRQTFDADLRKEA